MKTLIVILALLAMVVVAGDDKDQREALVDKAVSYYRSLLSTIDDKGKVGEPPSLTVAREVYLKVLTGYRETQARDLATQTAYDKEIEAVRKLAVVNLSKAAQRVAALMPGHWKVKCTEWNRGKSREVQFSSDGLISPDVPTSTKSLKIPLKVGDDAPNQYQGDWAVKGELLVLSLTERGVLMEVPLNRVSENFSASKEKITVSFEKQK